MVQPIPQLILYLEKFTKFVGEIHRNCKSCTQFEDVKFLNIKLVNHKLKVNEMQSKLSRFFNTKPACVLKYWKILGLMIKFVKY